MKTRPLTDSQIKRINRIRWYYRIKFALYTLAGFGLVFWGLTQFPVGSKSNGHWVLGIIAFCIGSFITPFTRWGDTSVGKRMKEDENYEINAIHRESRDNSGVN